MKIKIFSSAVLGMLLAGSALADIPDEGYYGSAKLLSGSQKTKSMEPYSPRATGLISGPDSDRKYNGSLAFGYQFGNGWRTDGEYTFKQKSTFVTYWTPFSTSSNNFQVSTQRLMLNGYRDIPMGRDFSAYGTLGIGVAFVSAGGWQGNTGRQFENRSQNNLAYSAGVGVKYSLNKQVSVDLGYRYVDMGNVKSGLNNFSNFSNTRDEQYKARLVSNEIYLGLSSMF